MTLIIFAISYLCDSAFSVVLIMKREHSWKGNIEENWEWLSWKPKIWDEGKINKYIFLFINIVSNLIVLLFICSESSYCIMMCILSLFYFVYRSQLCKKSCKFILCSTLVISVIYIPVCGGSSTSSTPF
jgi:hypothetical protein